MELNIEQYLSKFRIFHPSSLFPPTQAELIYFLRKKKCPLCLRSLYMKQDGSIWFCRSKKKDGFVIKGATMAKYLTK